MMDACCMFSDGSIMMSIRSLPGYPCVAVMLIPARGARNTKA